MDRHCRACPAIQARLASDVLRKMVKLCAILNFGDRSLRSPLWYGSPGRPPWPGLLFNSSQIFPSLRSNPQRLFAMDGGSDGAPSPSPVPALGTRSPAPPCGASLFLGGAQAWPQRLTSPLWGGWRAIALKQRSGSASSASAPGNPPPGEGLSKQRTGSPPTPQSRWLVPKVA